MAPKNKLNVLLETFNSVHEILQLMMEIEKDNYWVE